MNYRIILLLALLLMTFSASGEGNREQRFPKETHSGGSRNSGMALWADVHGAGAQRSDPKSGDASEYANGFGPQGDARRINNMVRPVRLISSEDLPYPLVDTGQRSRYDNFNAVADSTRFPGQDADYENLPPSYTDNGDGTVSDNVTGLMWQQDPGEKMTWSEASDAVGSFRLGGYNDWRIPTIKELYSLILFTGTDVDPKAEKGGTPFINTEYFQFTYGDTGNNERVIDSQYMSSTLYVSTTMGRNKTVFGVNFADGRIKGYPVSRPETGKEKEFFVLFVRGNPDYGRNDFIDNGDGTVTDIATGLMWLEEDSGPMNWRDALVYCDSLEYAGYDDWRLPDAKELQSLVDYSRSPDTTDSPAVDPLFSCTPITNEAGKTDFGYYWSSTTHVSSAGRNAGSSAVYISFGRAMGNMASLSGNPKQTSSFHEPPPGRQPNNYIKGSYAYD